MIRTQVLLKSLARAALTFVTGPVGIAGNVILEMAESAMDDARSEADEKQLLAEI